MPNLDYSVLVTTRQSATRGVPAGKEDVQWVGSSSTLIHDGHDAILVDTFLGKDDNARLLAWVQQAGYDLKAIYITHGHGDHWFGVSMLLEHYPHAIVYATRGTIACMKENNAQSWLDRWHAGFPGQVARNARDLFDPSAVRCVDDQGHRFQLGSHEFVVHEAGFTDTHSTTFVHVPSLDLVVAGDIVYNGVFPYLGATTTDTRREWQRALDAIAALQPRNVVPGHTVPDGGHHPRHVHETKQILADFDAHVDHTSSALELYHQVLALHPTRVNPGSLWVGCIATKPE
ncbi:Zn-dependent hydrolase [Gongronella butleri]|nr:Zn-dependent hydrolase [Gongronella butleri]